MPKVACVDDGLDPMVQVGKFAEDAHGLVLRTIVDEEKVELISVTQSASNLIEASIEFPDVVLFIVAGHHDGDAALGLGRG